MIHRHKYTTPLPNERRPYTSQRYRPAYSPFSWPWSYLCPVTGISIQFTNGKSRRGRAPKFHVFMPRWHRDYKRDYKHWRYTSRAWTDEEALAIALKSKKVQQWMENRWREEFNQMICD